MGKEKNDAIRINEVGHPAKDLLKSWWVSGRCAIALQDS